MTFLLLLAGLLILKIRYAVLLALVIALLDLLPVIGTGTLLLPLSVLFFAQGDAWRGVGLLLLYAIVLLVRQFAEPRLIGQHLGIHPLLSLLSMYAGMQWGGMAGMLLLPAALLTAKAVWQTASKTGEPGQGEGEPGGHRRQDHPGAPPL